MQLISLDKTHAHLKTEYRIRSTREKVVQSKSYVVLNRGKLPKMKF